ncbi:hypothetical protein [Rossellomorea marisflavi]|uniref:hypothetical protein n=1 Tax=Rossellomorea marisflavi TaxID=189381 RepID=UPI00165376C3|nr:hypothetical protein [Rossellomorea marisflavi]
MTVIAKYDIPLNDIYFIPEGTEMLAAGDENGFIIVMYKGQRYFLSELYLEVLSVGVL